MIFGDFQFCRSVQEAQEAWEAGFSGSHAEGRVRGIGRPRADPQTNTNPPGTECDKTQCEHTKRWLDTKFFPQVETSDAGLRALCKELGLPADADATADASRCRSLEPPWLLIY